MQIRVHPIQLAYKAKMHDVICELCGRCSPRTNAHPRVTHLVHLVKEHLPEVQATFSLKGRSEEVFQNVEG